MEAGVGRMWPWTSVCAWIIATCSDCSVPDNQPKPVVVHVTLTKTEKVGLHIFMKFCQKLGNSHSETYNMIHKTFGNKTMDHTQVKEWFRQFKVGWKSVESDDCSGRLSTSRNQLMIDKCVLSCWKTRDLRIWELSDELGFSFVSVQSIMTKDLGMTHVSAKFVPQLLTVESHLVHSFLAEHQIL